MKDLAALLRDPFNKFLGMRGFRFRDSGSGFRVEGLELRKKHVRLRFFQIFRIDPLEWLIALR